MRKEKEIKFAIGMLKAAGNEVQTLQATVLENRCTEAWVFENYVKNVAEENKDEAKFFAARDAARYLAGSIELEELLPDIDFSMIVSEKGKSTNKKITVDTDVIIQLINQISILNSKLTQFIKENRGDVASQKAADVSKGDFINQVEACTYVGCSKMTLKSWTDKGLVTGYRQTNRVLYSKSELDASPVVQNYRNLKKIKKHE